MNVKELIQELIEYDMDSQVEVVVGDDEISEFDVDGTGAYLNKYLRITVDAKGKTLIDDKELEEMEDKIESIGDFENRIKELEAEVESLENILNEK